MIETQIKLQRGACYLAAYHPKETNVTAYCLQIEIGTLTNSLGLSEKTHYEIVFQCAKQQCQMIEN